MSSLPGSPKTPSIDHLAQQRNSHLATNEIKIMPSSPPSPSKVLSATPDKVGSSGAAETKQGMPEFEPAAKKKATPGRKRKAATTSSGDDTGAEPAAKRKRATPAAATKKPATKKRSPKTTKIVVEDLEGKAKAQQPFAPLAGAVQHKLLAVDAFLDTHTSPLIAREEGSNIAIVDELDLLAALIILRVDYQVESSSIGVSLDDAGDMIVAQLDAGKVSVDFDKTCDTERAVQAKLEGRGTGLEDVNLVEVEVEMLVAKRKQLVEDEEPDAGFSVYGEGAEEGETAGQSSMEAV
jgi:hypothetical protein